MNKSKTKNVNVMFQQKKKKRKETRARGKCSQSGCDLPQIHEAKFLNETDVKLFKKLNCVSLFLRNCSISKQRPRKE